MTLKNKSCNVVDLTFMCGDINVIDYSKFTFQLLLTIIIVPPKFDVRKI